MKAYAFHIGVMRALEEHGFHRYDHHLFAAVLVRFVVVLLGSRASRPKAGWSVFL